MCLSFRDSQNAGFNCVSSANPLQPGALSLLYTLSFLCFVLPLNCGKQDKVIISGSNRLWASLILNMLVLIAGLAPIPCNHWVDGCHGPHWTSVYWVILLSLDFLPSGQSTGLSYYLISCLCRSGAPTTRYFIQFCLWWHTDAELFMKRLFSFILSPLYYNSSSRYRHASHFGTQRHQKQGSAKFHLGFLGAVTFVPPGHVRGTQSSSLPVNIQRHSRYFTLISLRHWLCSTRARQRHPKQ